MSGSPPLALEFVTSASRAHELPDSPAELAVVGRSNVGKSSLINALANRKSLARTSKTPGRTQLLNLFALRDGRTVMDLPGYGYAKVSAQARADWPRMIEGYLLEREPLRAVVVLIDAAVGPTGNDRSTIEWLRSHDLPLRFVATKADKVKPSKRDGRRRDLAEGCGVGRDEVSWVSATAGTGIDELRGRFLEWLTIDP